MDYIPGNHSLHMLTYHLIFVVKYRKPVITDEIGDHLKEYTSYLLELSKCKLVSAETDRDHIHILFSAPPTIQLSKLVRTLKVALSKDAHQRYADEIGQYLYGDKCPLWSSSYFIATTGSISMKTVQSYIESQRTEAHKRKYTYYKRKKRQQ